MSIVSMIADIATAVSAVIAVFTIITNARVRKKDTQRKKKQATLEAVNVLQNEVLDKITFYTDSRIEEIAKDKRSEEFKTVAAMLARCEHFAVGVYEDIYDYSTVQALFKDHLVYQYKKLKPIIDTKRKGHSDKYYSSFEKLANELANKSENDKKEKL